MVQFPAKCQKCGCLFHSGISIRSARSVTMSNNRQSCPRCGAMADIASGQFDVSSSGVVTQTGGFPVESDWFTGLGLVLLHAELEKLKPEQVVAMVAPHSSDLADRLRRVADDPIAFAAVLSALIAAFAAIAVAVISNMGEPNRTEVEINLNQQIDLEKGREALEQMRRERRAAPAWSSDYI